MDAKTIPHSHHCLSHIGLIMFGSILIKKQFFDLILSIVEENKHILIYNGRRLRYYLSIEVSTYSLL